MVNARYDTAFTLYPYQPVPEQQLGVPVRHPVVVVGGGPIGLAMALDLGRKGTPVLLLDDHDGVGLGSRAICFARRTLEIANRLGFADKLLEKGVVWNVGRVFHGDGEIFQFNLSPQANLKYPAFINLQQPYFEKYLVDQIRVEQALGAPIEIRGKNQVIECQVHTDFVALSVATPDGTYALEADWVVACDGARSPVRDMLGLSFEGRVFEDNFLIADVKMKAPFPTERWFWFEPTFKHAGQSALLHKQPDDIWRIDFQLGWDIDKQHELNPERIRSRVDGMLGEGIAYELEWTSIYTFQCRRMKKFRHQRVLFAGDSAHQVSPFGARGANSGMHDIDNLAWKLDLVVKKQAPEKLLDTYCDEREYGADENILHSTRATDFLTPKSKQSRRFRNAVLALSARYPFARPMVNSGRLSVPCIYDTSPLNGPDELTEPECTRVGAPCIDVNLQGHHLLDSLTDHFYLLAINTFVPDSVQFDGVTIQGLHLTTEDDSSDCLRMRYLGNAPTAIYLIRPDQHIAARWMQFDESMIQKAMSVLLAKEALL